MTIALIIGAIIIACIAAGARSNREYTDDDYPYMTQDGWKHTFHQGSPDGNWYQHKRMRRNDPWRDRTDDY